MENSNSSETISTDEDIKKLCDGLLNIYQEPIQKVSSSLKELTNKQKTLIEIVEAQNHDLDSCQNSDDIKQLFAEVIHCRDRLVTIKKQMISIHDRSTKLRIRSQNVMNRAKMRQNMRLQELEREQRLIGGQDTQQK